MIEMRQGRLVIDGRPVLVFAGEIHYFRLRREDWRDRLLKARDLGIDAVAAYIPWLVHEPRRGDVDLTGRRRPENDLAAFIDLCGELGLWFLARPGPFIMAEMKNEGIPYWVARENPSARPVTWGGRPGRSHTLDYGDPGFLGAAKGWYDAVMPVLAARLQPSGGPVLGVQLDNEIGMLSWVHNDPDLNDGVLAGFRSWLGARYREEELRERYPFDQDELAKWREPSDAFAKAFRADYADFSRVRYADYVSTLRSWAEAAGARDVPFLVNVHGTGNGRAFTYPIGLQQLMVAYTQSPGYLMGSDHYLGELTRQNAPDLYVLNAFGRATQLPDQPLSSLEFEVGTGDYGETMAARQSGESTDLKVRMSLAQGNRLLNYYLLAGGENPPLEDPVGDGNDRVAFTGQRHGFAAPISPEGVLDPTYHALRQTTRRMAAIADKLADMDEEHDPVALGFLPSAYATEYALPGPAQAIVRELEWPRGTLDILARAMLFLGFRFPALDVENGVLEPATTPVLALSAPTHLAQSVQAKLLAYVRAGGNLLLVGACPTHDLEGRPCTLLADGLGVRPDGWHEASSANHLSLTGQGFAADHPEFRVWRAQTFCPGSGQAFLTITGEGAPCGVIASAGSGRAVLLPANVPCHLELFRRLFAHLGAAPVLTHDDPDAGIMLLSTKNQSEERFVFVLNLDTHVRSIQVLERGVPLFGGHRVPLAPKQGKTLPIGVTFGPHRVDWSTVDLVSGADEPVRFVDSPFIEHCSVDGRIDSRTPRAEGFWDTGSRIDPLL